MKKNIIIICALFLSVVSGFAQELKFAKTSDLVTGAQSSYDGKTSTITFDSDWAMRGWWLNGADYSKIQKATFEFEPVSFLVQIVVQYNTSGEPKYAMGSPLYNVHQCISALSARGANRIEPEF